MLEFKIHKNDSKFRTKKNPQGIPPKPKVSAVFCIISILE